MDEQRVLSWLTSQDVFEIKDEIEEVNRKMLDKLLDENEFVSVFFCKLISLFLKLNTFILTQLLEKIKQTKIIVKSVKKCYKN